MEKVKQQVTIENQSGSRHSNGKQAETCVTRIRLNAWWLPFFPIVLGVAQTEP